MLSKLGYDPDQAQKRLGDGLYEQRLIRDAITARTGQRFIAGLDSDEAMFRYLMNNAIASKEALQLTVGVSLSAAQVAALTHDIVWMEEVEVAGEKVLAPVLYMAQPADRLMANGALIQGRDVTLISGGSLNNSGTLRASNNLSATAGTIDNRGLIESGNRLELMATDSIRNAAGGIIAGRDVSLVARAGDIINERTVTTVTGSGRDYQYRADVVTAASRIEAANDLNIIAGRDVQSLGSVIQAGGDARIEAGRDALIASQREEDNYSYEGRRQRGSQYQITQHGSEVQVGGDLAISAGRDLGVIASRVEAVGNISLEAADNLVVAAAANESHEETFRKHAGKKTERIETSVSQQKGEITAGGSLVAVAGSDMTLVASDLRSGDEAFFYAGGDLSLLAAQDSDYSLYDMKKKGSWGSKKTQRDEVTDVRNVGSTITTGGDLTLVSEGDQLYQKARLESGNDLVLDAGGAIVFEGVKDLHQESHEKSSNSLAWTSAKGKGNTDETLQQSVLIAKGETVIKAVDGLRIDIKDVNKQTVSQTIDAMVKADPELAWIKEMEQRGDVDWRQVKEIHDSFKYSHSGLGGGAAIVIAIIVAYFTAGAASAAIGNLASAAAGSGSAMAAAGSSAMVTAGTAAGTAAAGWGNAALTAVAVSSASGAAVSTINNRGNLGAVLKDVTSEEALKGYAVGAVTAGLTAGVFDKWTSTETGANTAGAATGNSGVLANSGAVASAGGLSSWSGIGQFAANQALQNGTSTLLNKALGQGGSLGDALQTTLANTFAAAGFNFIGDISMSDQMALKDGSLAKIGLHAVMGGLAAEAAGGDFKTGALAAGINEALVSSLAKQYEGMDPDKKKGLLVMNSQLIGVLAAAAQGGDEKDLQTGAWVAQQGTIYNHDLHQKNAESYAEGILAACAQKPDLCGPGYSEVSKQDLVDALKITAAHGEGIETVDPETLNLLNQFLTMFPSASDTLFTPTESEQKRIDVLESAELVGAGISLAGAAKSVIKNGGTISSWLSGLFGRGPKGAGGAVDDLASSKVKWVDENAGMSSRARDYNDSATGARSNPATQSGQAPALERTMPDGSTRLVKFDGVDGNVLVDRKISVVTTSKSKDQALRQSEVLSQNGLTARWEVPTQAQANRAQKMFDELGIKNISGMV